MKSSDLKLNPKLKENLYKKNGKLYSKKPLTIMFPNRYTSIDLAITSSTISYLGVCILVFDNQYMKMLIPSMFETKTDKVSIVKIDDEEYFSLFIDKDKPILETTKLLKVSDIAYHIVNEFVIKGKVPFFIQYYDLPKILDLSPKYTGGDLFNNPIKGEIFLSVIGRWKSDPSIYGRTIKNKNDIEFIGLGDPNFGVLNNLGRISASYLDAGITAALNDDDIRHNELEEHLLR